MEWTSEFWGRSEASVFDLEAAKGDADGIGESPEFGRSGTGGDGTNTVFLTSRRPLLAVGFRGVATCCAFYFRT